MRARPQSWQRQRRLCKRVRPSQSAGHKVAGHLAWLSASSGQWGRAVDLAGADTGAAAQYLDRAAARAAARLKMKVEERTGDAPSTAEQVKARLIAAFPKAKGLLAASLNGSH
jgi:hypothetical protein